MIKRRPLLIILIICLFRAVNGYGQADTLVINRNIAALQKYAAGFPIEKVHLHLDRPWYGLGDTIWFKAYVVSGEDHSLSDLSGVLYAELINEKDSVVNRLTMGLDSGISHGDFVLPFTYKSGVYRLRAYTNWMRNAGPDYFYDQKIIVAGLTPPEGSAPVRETTSLANNIVTNSPGNIDVQFFPEGGDLVNGLRSKVAFKAINKAGLAEDIQGIITDTQGNEVASFGSQHLGMGDFPLTPQKGKQYIAKIMCADGSSFGLAMPAAKDAGFTLTVNNNSSSDSVYVTVAANDLIVKSKQDTAFSVIAQSQGKVYFAGSGRISSKTFSAQIPKSRFPSGIVQFTLFSQSGEPLNERIIFIQNKDQLDLKLSTEKQSHAPGEKVKINLEAEGDSKPAAGTFSVSVTDETKVPVDEQPENTIFTDLLLKSELSGHIENPNYYFMNPDDKTRTGLDLLMLTQGYRRFEWKKILNNNSASITYQPETGLTIAGTVKTLAGKPVPKGRIILSSVKNHLAADTLTDEKGNFAFNNINLPDTATMVINAKKATGGKNVMISFAPPVYSPVTAYNDIAGYAGSSTSTRPDLSTSYKEQINKAYTSWHPDPHTIELKEVKIKDSKIPPFHPDYAKILKYSANLNGPGNANQVYLASDETLRYSSLAGALYGKLPGVNIVISPDGRGIAVSQRTIVRHLAGPLKAMAVYVDGMLTQPDYIGYINPADVLSVEVLTSAMYYSIYGSNATGGALIITLKNGSEILDSTAPAPGTLTYKFNGYYKARQFYTPKYDASKTVSLADNRKTIYWNPNLTTGANGKTSFDYFNAGSKGNYRVVIEGIDEGGKLGRQVLRYNVE